VLCYSEARVLRLPSRGNERFTGTQVVRSLWAAERSSWVVGVLVKWVLDRGDWIWLVVGSVDVVVAVAMCSPG
jgi:hypothetical protein